MADSLKLGNDPDPWVNRIVGHEEVDADQLLANPLNARIHTRLQQDSTAGLLDEIGWVKSVQVNTITGHIVDGHLRVMLAMRKGVKVPVEYVVLSQEEERKALALLDYLASMAKYDNEILAQLLDGQRSEDDALRQVLHLLVASAAPKAPEFDPGNAPEGEQAEDTAPLTAASHVRMVQLFLNAGNIDQFSHMTAELAKKYGTQSLTDTVWEAVEREYGNHSGESPLF